MVTAPSLVKILGADDGAATLFTVGAWVGAAVVEFRFDGPAVGFAAKCHVECRMVHLLPPMWERFARLSVRKRIKVHEMVTLHGMRMWFTHLQCLISDTGLCFQLQSKPRGRPFRYIRHMIQLLPRLLLLLCTFTSCTQASPALMATPGLTGAFGFETSTPTDSSNVSVSCSASLGNGQYTLPSSQCIYGACMKLSSTTIACPRTSGGLNPAAFTIAAWLSPISTVYLRTTMIFFNVMGSGQSVQFGINFDDLFYNGILNTPQVIGNNNAYLSYLNGTGYQFPFTGASTVNWTHVAYVFNGAYIRLYANGILQSAFIESTDLTTIVSGSHFFIIGASSGVSGLRLTSFNGFIDDLGIFSVALNQSQISALYNVAFTPQPTSQPTLAPSSAPTINTTSVSPTSIPTSVPTANPSKSPTGNPSSVPTGNPTNEPIGAPTAVPSGAPTVGPTSVPSSVPTSGPTSAPLSAADYFTNDGNVTIALWFVISALFLAAVWFILTRSCFRQQFGYGLVPHVAAFSSTTKIENSTSSIGG